VTRAVGLLGRIVTFADDRGIRKVNPVQGVKDFQPLRQSLGRSAQGGSRSHRRCDSRRDERSL
jgi:hypothetical protein